MKSILILLLFGILSMQAQTIDYNTKKGYAAEGYDVVAYFKSAAKEGDKKFTATHDGVKYKFLSK